MLGFLIRVAVNALAIVAAAAVFPGISVDGVWPAVLAGLVLGLVNATVRPVLRVITFPLTVITLGLFLLVLNGLCLWLVAAVVDGFAIAGFWSAVFGAVLVSIVSWILTALVSDSGRISMVRWRR